MHVAISFIGRGNWGTQRKPPTCRKSLNNFNLSHNVVSGTSLLSGVELTMFVDFDRDNPDNICEVPSPSQKIKKVVLHQTLLLLFVLFLLFF